MASIAEAPEEWVAVTIAGTEWFPSKKAAEDYADAYPLRNLYPPIVMRGHR